MSLGLKGLIGDNNADDNVVVDNKDHDDDQTLIIRTGISLIDYVRYRGEGSVYLAAQSALGNLTTAVRPVTLTTLPPQLSDNFFRRYLICITSLPTGRLSTMSSEDIPHSSGS